MFIVDAQIHIWTGHKPVNPAHRQVLDYTAAQVLRDMDDAGVDAAVIHPPGWDPGSNALAVEAARQHPDRLAILAHFPLDAPDSRTMLARVQQHPGVLGLRFALLQPHQKTWLVDGSLDWLWAQAEASGMPVALFGEHLVEAVGRIAPRHPGLKLIVDHFGRPDRAWSNLEAVAALAQYPNVALKATGAPGNAQTPYPFPDLDDRIRRLFDAFGPHRMFWGTDITRMPVSWRQCITHFTEELPWLGGRDRELVMGEALCRWLGWHPGGRFR